tara:strand:+ start:119 stop:388 length:270 start_codon:yes stop_codon:yes gene_type:complete
MKGNIVLKEGNGDFWEADTPLNLVKQMKLSDWSQPSSVEEYMRAVQGRVATVATILGNETTFVYWDATSFLIGYANCTNGVVRINGVVQ